MARIDLENITLKSINMEMETIKNSMINDNIANMQQDIFNLKITILNYEISNIISGISSKLSTIRELLDKNLSSLVTFIDTQLKDYEITEEEAEANVMKQLNNMKSLQENADYKNGNITEYNIDANTQSVLNDVRASWGDDLEPERIEFIERAASLINKGCKYSMTKDNPGAAKPDYLDCSGYVTWAMTQEGHSDIPLSSTTATFITSSKFHKVSHSELKPGDLCFKNLSTAGGGKNHVGIYIGKNSKNQDVFLHCSYSKSQPEVSTYGTMFKEYFTYDSWQK